MSGERVELDLQPGINAPPLHCAAVLILCIFRYEVKPEEWGPDKFSPYCSGGGYTLNSQAIHVSKIVF